MSAGASAAAEGDSGYDDAIPVPTKGSNRNINSGSNSPLVEKQSSYTRKHKQAIKAPDMSKRVLSELDPFQLEDTGGPFVTGLVNRLFRPQRFPNFAQYLVGKYTQLKNTLKAALISCPSYLPFSLHPFKTGQSLEEPEEEVLEEDFSAYADHLQEYEDEPDPDEDAGQSDNKPQGSLGKKKPSDERDYREWFTTINTHLNQLALDVCAAAGHRSWYSTFHNKSMEGVTPDRRKPDLILADNTATNLKNWLSVRSVCEVTRIRGFPPKFNGQLAQRATLILLNNPGRRFVPILGISGDQFRLSVFHRSGVRHSKRYNLEKDIGHLYHILAGLYFSTDEAIGYNPYILLDADSNPCELEFHGKKGTRTFRIVEQVFVKEGIQGRGTVVFKLVCKDNDEVFIGKLAWIDENRLPSEIELYEELNKYKIPGIPILYDYEDVHVNGVKDTTGYWRPENIPEKEYQSRTFRVILLKGTGRPLWHFKTKEELLTAIIDIVIAHRKACEQAGILHRDISLSNLLLVDLFPLLGMDGASAESLNTMNETIRGLLIDFDYACRVSQSGPRVYKTAEELRTNTRTGTLPFMAIEVLRGVNKKDDVFYHTFQMDLESIVYVLLYICIHYAGPNNTPRDDLEKVKDNLKMGIPTDKWMERDKTWKDLASQKTTTWTQFKTDTAPWIHPYFKDMTSMFTELEDVLFSPAAMKEADENIPEECIKDNTKTYQGSRASYDEFLTVLYKYREIVKEPDTNPPGPGPSSADSSPPPNDVNGSTDSETGPSNSNISGDRLTSTHSSITVVDNSSNSTAQVKSVEKGTASSRRRRPAADNNRGSGYNLRTPEERQRSKTKK